MAFLLVGTRVGRPSATGNRGLGEAREQGMWAVGGDDWWKNKYYHVIIIVIADYTNINSPRFFSF